jgi:hypothetical protein
MPRSRRRQRRLRSQRLKRKLRRTSRSQHRRNRSKSSYQKSQSPRINRTDGEKTLPSRAQVSSQTGQRSLHLRWRNRRLRLHQSLPLSQ